MSRPASLFLGRNLQPSPFDARQLLAEDFITLNKLPVLPNRQDWFLRGNRINSGRWGYLGNNQAGNCVYAGLTHGFQQWTVNATGVLADFSAQAVLDAYSNATGYDPHDPTTDRGDYCVNGLRYMQKTGIRDTSGAVHKVRAYVKVNPLHHAMVRAAAFLSSGLYIGATLHSGIWGSEIWDAPKPGETIEGGHAMDTGEVGDRLIRVIDWNTTRGVTWDWWDVEVSECFGVVSDDQFDGQGKTVAGFDFEGLLEAVDQVTA